MRSTGVDDRPKISGSTSSTADTACVQWRAVSKPSIVNGYVSYLCNPKKMSSFSLWPDKRAGQIKRGAGNALKWHLVGQEQMTILKLLPTFTPSCHKISRDVFCFAADEISLKSAGVELFYPLHPETFSAQHGISYPNSQLMVNPFCFQALLISPSATGEKTNTYASCHHEDISNSCFLKCSRGNQLQ